MSPRETKAEKALRFIAERRLLITRVDRERIRATCRGDSGQVYLLGFEAGDGWACSCEAKRTFNRECSHLAALKLVTAIERVEAAGGVAA